jgi:hypothetical protein
MNAESSPNRQFDRLNISRRQVNLRFALIRQSDVYFDKELATGEPPALREPGLGPFGPGNGDPYVTLRLREQAPTGGDRGEIAAYRNLYCAAGVKRDKRGVADLTIAIALPNDIPALPGFGIGHFHNQHTGVGSIAAMGLDWRLRCQRQNALNLRPRRADFKEGGKAGRRAGTGNPCNLGNLCNPLTCPSNPQFRRKLVVGPRRPSLSRHSPLPYGPFLEQKAEFSLGGSGHHRRIPGMGRS